MWSNPPSQAGPPGAGCPGPCPDACAGPLKVIQPKGGRTHVSLLERKWLSGRADMQNTWVIKRAHLIYTYNEPFLIHT